MEKYFNTFRLNENETDYFVNLCKTIAVEGESAFFAGFPFIDDEEENKIIKGLLIYSGGIIVFYSCDNDMDVYKRYLAQQLLKSSVLSAKINYDFDSYITYSLIGNKNITISNEHKFNSNDIRIIVGILQKINALKKKDKRQIEKQNSLGNIIVERSEVEANLDSEQFQFIYDDSLSNVNIRVRGLAGCGKTILLAEKMAYLHYKDNSKLLGYVFYTKSLKQSIDSFFVRFYSQIAGTAEIPNKEKIRIMHGWGSYQYPGLYSTICDWLRISNVSYEENPDFNKLCGNLIKTIKELKKENDIKRFDYILIDEAQDFSINFFKLARMCLKPDGKIIYAYDELQALNETNKRMPLKKEIFENDSCKDINLSKCYRTPKEILVTAHALGLGIYHFNEKGEREIINAVQDKTVWKAIGYDSVPSKIVEGKDVSLSREVVIDNPLEDGAIVCKDFNDQESQNSYVINEIVRLIKEEEIISDDILIIDLDSRNINFNYSSFLSEYYKLYPDGYDNPESLPFGIDVINKESGYNFRTKGRVSYTTIFRAKGNESNIVFILNSNNSDTILSYNRNRLFTAMTRAKFKVYICGTGQQFIDSISNEIMMVKEHNYCLDFNYPTKEELDKCYRKVYEDNQTSERVNEALDLLSGNGSEGLSEESISTFLNRLNEADKKKFFIQLNEQANKKKE